jgi:hypothetical protein
LFTQGQRHFIHRTELGRAHLGPDPDAPARRAGAPGQARLRVQRFATVEESRADGVEPGRRVWGDVPAGTYAVVAPVCERRLMRD